MNFILLFLLAVSTSSYSQLSLNEFNGAYKQVTKFDFCPTDATLSTYHNSVILNLSGGKFSREVWALGKTVNSATSYSVVEVESENGFTEVKKETYSFDNQNRTWFSSGSSSLKLNADFLNKNKKMLTYENSVNGGMAIQCSYVK